MNYKEGEKVIIKSREWYNENKDEYGTIIFSTESGDYSFTKEDVHFCGRVVTIEYEGDGHYLIAEDDRGYFWIDEMIKGPSTSAYNEGDFVGVYGYETDVRIEEVRWDGSSYSYKVYLADEEEWIDDSEIAYKAETYESPETDEPKPSLNGFMDMLDNEIKLPDGYVLKDENGNVINTTKITLEKKKKKYPKTYQECCTVLGFHYDHYLTYIDEKDINPTKEEEEFIDLIDIFSRLIVCRNAYWKIAGEEMGLGKPWKPDYTDSDQDRYAIVNFMGNIEKSKWDYGYSITFVFPTEEMQDAFKEYFKVEIESCKELL